MRNGPGSPESYKRISDLVRVELIAQLLKMYPRLSRYAYMNDILSNCIFYGTLDELVYFYQICPYLLVTVFLFLGSRLLSHNCT